MFHRVIGAELAPQLLDSDHYAIFMKLRIMKRLNKNTQTRSRRLNLDYSITLKTESIFVRNIK